jgi:small subunit ribosomal protein S9
MSEDPQRPGEDAPESGEGAPGPEIEGADQLAGAVPPQEPAEEAAEPAPEAEEPAPEAEEPAPEAEEEPAPEAEEEPAPEAEEEAAPEAEEEAAAEAEEPAVPEADEPAAPEAEEAAAPESDEAAPAEAPRAERPRPGRRRTKDDGHSEEVIPGAHLEPDLVLEEQAPEAEGEYGQYDEYAGEEAAPVAAEDAEPAEEAPAEPEPVERQPLDLARDARYHATGKRKSAVARVILRPGEGSYRINGRHLDEYFPRVRLQRMAQQPLEAAGYNTRLDVVARVHGGGVSAQAGALRHGVARALVEADPALRGELKRRGYLTRDPRVKERKKAGLKKARKRPQFSKR